MISEKQLHILGKPPVAAFQARCKFGARFQEVTFSPELPLPCPTP